MGDLHEGNSVRGDATGAGEKIHHIMFHPFVGSRSDPSFFSLPSQQPLVTSGFTVNITFYFFSKLFLSVIVVEEVYLRMRGLIDDMEILIYQWEENN